MLKKYIITFLLIIGYNNMLFSDFPLWWIAKKLTLNTGLQVATNGFQLMFMVSPAAKKYFADKTTKLNSSSLKIQGYNSRIQYLIALGSLYPSSTSFSKCFSHEQKNIWYKLGSMQERNIFYY